MAYKDGMFTGATAEEFHAAEDWLGYDLDFSSWSANRTSWSALLSSIDYTINETKGLGTEIHWTIPLVTYNHDLQQAANHDFDGFYRQAAEKLAATIPEGEKLVIRTGEEFNGGWFAWAAAGQEDLFAQAYRNFVDVFRSVSPDFQFEWNVGLTVTGTDLAKAYPGSDYVDYIGGDMYWDSKKDWSIKNAGEAFAYFRDHEVGLDWLADFAGARGKPIAFSEWALNGDSAWFIQQFHDWMDQENVAYQSYWNSDASFQSELTQNQHWYTGLEYKEQFGPEQVTQTSYGDTVMA